MFTQFDVIVSVISLVFILLGFLKGGLRSVMGLAKWYGAGILTFIFYPTARELIGDSLGGEWLTNGVAVIGTYIVMLIGLSLIISILVAALGSAVGGPLDRLAGGLVGLTIGAIIGSTGHFFVKNFNEGTEPQWLKDGKTYQITEAGSEILSGYFQEAMNSLNGELNLGVDTNASEEQINQKIKEIEEITGTTIDMQSFKDAVLMMKEQGMEPSQIKNLINPSDFTKPTGGKSINQESLNQGIQELLKIKDSIPSGNSKE